MTAEPNKSKQKKGRWVKGQSGNPSGLTKGLQGIFKEALKDELPELIKKTLELAKAGDMQAMTLLINKTVPNPRAETFISEPFAIDDKLPQKVERTLDLMFNGKLPIELTGEILKAVEVYTNMQQNQGATAELLVKNLDIPPLLENHGVTITECKSDE